MVDASRRATYFSSMDGVHEARLIKRYANRKLYDTETSRYVTLNQIATMIREGEDVRVIDNTSKEDLTSVTFAQIIYESEKNKKNNTSSAKLKEIIERSGERLMHTFQKGPVGKFVQEGSGRPARENAVTRLLNQSREAVEDLQRKADHQMRGAATAVGRQFQQIQAEVGKLQARIEELEQRLGRKKASSPPPSSDEPEKD